MSIRTRLLEAGALAVLVAIAGTVAYMLIEDLALLDAMYLTVITISTVGFSEPAGGFSPAGQVTTMIVIFLGVGTVFYAATSTLEYAVEEVLGGTLAARRQRRRIGGMRTHTIICGYGRIGRHVYEFLERGQRQVVVVDTDEAAAAEARAAGLAVVVGDATDDEILSAAGLDEAGVLIAAVEDDPANLAIVLSARAHRPKLRIVARANETQTESKLLLAGADRVVTPSVVGAARIAQMAYDTDVADFVDIQLDGDLLELQVEECTLGRASQLVGQTIATSGIRKGSGAMVVAVVTPGGDRIVNPGPEVELDHGQTVIAMGTAEQIAAFRSLTG